MSIKTVTSNVRLYYHSFAALASTLLIVECLVPVHGICMALAV